MICEILKIHDVAPEAFDLSKVARAGFEFDITVLIKRIKTGTIKAGQSYTSHTFLVSSPVLKSFLYRQPPILCPVLPTKMGKYLKFLLLFCALMPFFRSCSSRASELTQQAGLLQRIPHTISFKIILKLFGLLITSPD